jgi:hypothetical protein
MAGNRKIDKVRASRDGHEFHEAWTARKAMQLLWPASDLTAIAVEGPSPSDQTGASAATLEVADITLYFGGQSTFEWAARTTFAQFKYSIADRDKNFRASNANKTVKKFGQTYRTYKRKYGAQAVEDKLDFQIITNQPISDALLQAIHAIATGTSGAGDVKTQATQLKTASGLTGQPLAGFAKKLKIIGRSGSLSHTKDELASLLVDWSATGSDPIAAARLGKLRELVREKAGYAGTDRNLITRTDILAALQIRDPKDLLPCEPALVDVGKVLERAQLADALARLESTPAPLLIHATGGVGKTVFMDTLAAKIAHGYEVVFFDCFGGGAYRSPEDARHLPKKGLIHIANTLAFRGVCDPMLPDSPDLQTLLSTFRRRLTQCVATISRVTPGRQLALFIDAIDNAEFAARQRSEDCFPVKLLESLDAVPIAGVKLIVSCRTERKPKTYARYDEFELHPFTKDETASFLSARLKSVSQAEINVAQARSGGNPRVLDYLLKAGRGLLDPSEIDKEIELDELIQKRITDALGAALVRGYDEKDVNAFLAGLAVLPPPVPLGEYAGAHGIDISAIESFASDLRPLLERTSHGLMFRDEPTETLVHRRYMSREALQRVAANLLARQETSVYAARSLPGLLHELDDTEQLFALAFDERIPASIASTVGKRNVQYARLKAATLHAALRKDYNSLVRLLLELSTIAAVDQRGVDYILDHPDLVVAAKDVDARRRLFEIRTGWPGTRHARLAIAHTLSAEFEEAYRHAYADSEWIEHYLRTERGNGPRESGPEHADIAAIPFFLISQGRGADAARYLERWRDWYSYEVCEFVFTWSHLSQTIRAEPRRRLGAFNGALASVGSLAAALSFDDLPRAKRKDLATKLAKLCQRATQPHLPDHYTRRRTYELEDGLRKAAAIALTLGFGADALRISRRARHNRPGVWAFRDAFNHHDVFSFVFQAAIVAAAKNQPLHEKDLLPKELVRICSRIPKTLTGKPFRDKAKDNLSKVPRKPRDDEGMAKHPDAMSYDEQQGAERFLGTRLEPLLSITGALSTVLAASARSVDKGFVDLVKTWEQVRANRDQYRTEGVDPFFHLLGLEAVLFVLWTRSELKPESVKQLLTAIHSHSVGASDIVRIVSVLTKRAPLQTLAGEQAIKARTLIEKEDEVNYRASLYGTLGRAMLPASIDEASVYFRHGLEQMDAIGSGDYQFTNELLLFASQIKGDELSERDFHTLTNICELNMGEEPEKFFWGAFGRGVAKAAGLRALAKLSRWDDRSKIALDNTLLPYLIGLLEAGKIGAKDALALNRLANPVEYWFSSTKEFAEALRQQAGPDPVAIAELINQFEDDNPNVAGADTVETLCSLAKEALGASHEITRHIAAARDQYAIAREGRNKRNSYSSEPDRKMRREAAKRDEHNRQELARIAAATDPLDEASLVKAIAAFNALGNMYDLKAGFFSALRDKVPFSGRVQYVRNIAALEDLYFYWKFAELKDAREAWAGSSAALSHVYRELAYPLILAHADDLVDHGRLSGSNIKEISEFTGISMAELVLEVIKVFSRPDSGVGGSVWLAFASFIAPEADEGQGQLALTRLLSSDAARLADNVVDGPWATGRYLSSDTDEIAAGLIWRVLGSPHAVDRWRAVHCLRSFARFGRWDVIDGVVHLFGSQTAGAFQAPELTFYYLHARLWLLIALARMALDHPEQIARYKDDLLAIATESDAPHVLMQDFAARTLLTCVASGKLALPAKTLEALRGVAKSPYPRLRKKIRTGGNFYHGRPKGVPKPSFEFHLDYDFHKHDVENLSHVFGMGCWEVADMMSSIVQKLDPDVTTMYAGGGRESRGRTPHGLTSRFHGYGQQLGWHALFFAAGRLLAARPVTDDWWYDDDPWGEWLGRYGLTRKDGLWLSDGTDRTPIDAGAVLLEPRKKGLAVTGAQDRLLQLAGLGTTRVGKELVIQARWFSADNIRIGISSALVPSSKAAQFARKLTREEPMIVWIPVFHGTEDDDEYSRGEKKEYTPWVVCPSGEARLDEHDPYGVSVADTRPRLARTYAALCKLTRDDPFGRAWLDNRGTASLRAQAWGRDEGDREGGPHPGMRLLCRSSVLKKIMTTHDKDLLVLINLQRYEKRYQGDGTYTHSVAVAHIDKLLDVEYFRGPINHLYRSRY